jgi:hypothetical protein
VYGVRENMAYWGVHLYVTACSIGNDGVCRFGWPRVFTNQ